MAQRIIEHQYKPREIFQNFHDRFQRWSILVVHRRGGKTVATINDTINRILYFTPPLVAGIQALEPGRFAYVAPYLNQARQIAWDYVKRYSQGMTKKVAEGELSVTFYNDAKLTLYGSDNPDAFRGQYFDGVVLDEFGMMKPSTWSEVILPTLVDRRGWATFIGTPNGPNHFRQLVRDALLSPERWFYESHPVSETKLISQEELVEMKKLMLPEEYAQEMECSFEASARGAFFSAEMMVAEKADPPRIGPILPNHDMPLHFVYDLGFRDDTATIAFQEATDGYPIIHAEADHLRPIAHYIQRIDEICRQYNCPRGVIWLPHDAKAKTLQTGRSIVEQFLAAGIRPQMVPFLDVLDGIQAARMLFKDIYFNEVPTRDLVEALKTYRREWDEDKRAFKNRPVEDWSVHYADVFRYFSLVAQKHSISDSPPKTHDQQVEQRIQAVSNGYYPISLNDLWETQDGNRRDGIR